MDEIHSATERPAYDKFISMSEARGPLARNFARQILETTAPFLPAPRKDLRVLDIGCGYGHTALELARECGYVVGLEPSTELVATAAGLKSATGVDNIEFRAGGIYELSDDASYDLVILDNVLEHLSDQARALEIISHCMKDRGVLYILVPNKLWPIEVHYRLPFLSYLPLSLANVYLRMSGRGTDYTDASYAPSYFGLKRLLKARKEWSFHFVLPADVSLAAAGPKWHYRLGVGLIRRIPALWVISKAFLVVVVKNPVR
jgi:2-polyprenyl-3-methyl-5-hydroxy-6-metoxy-1,4-benzoquinol methylase